MDKKDNGKLKRKSAYTVDPNDLYIVGLDGKEEDHCLDDERADDDVPEELVKNIMSFGVIEPVIAVKEGDRLVVVDGRQRVKAAREARKRLEDAGGAELRVPLLLRAGEDHRLLGVMVSANEHRREDDVLIKARKASRMIDLGATELDTANSFGVSTKTIKNWMKLLNVTSPVKDAISEGKVSATAAAELANLPPEEQAPKLDEMVAGGKTTKAKAKEIASGRKPAPPRRLLRKLADDVELADEDRDLLAWVIGDLEAAEIKWLPAALERALPKPKSKKKAAKKAPKKKTAKKEK